MKTDWLAIEDREAAEYAVRCSNGAVTEGVFNGWLYVPASTKRLLAGIAAVRAEFTTATDAL